MSQLRQYQQKFDGLNIDIKIVAFDDSNMVDKYVSESEMPWPVLSDPDRKLYSAYGMSAGSWWAIFNPVSMARYIRLILAGTRPGKPGSDWRQMGGDVLIDPDGYVRLHYVSCDPHDRPEPNQVFRIVSGNDSEAD